MKLVNGGRWTSFNLTESTKPYKLAKTDFIKLSW
ncbi:MAG: hypothetical protein ACI8SE_000907 [Bacteroidia bacterium]|jgi:hypothetical protein